jgi:hypothetical protein
MATDIQHRLTWYMAPLDLRHSRQRSRSAAAAFTKATRIQHHAASLIEVVWGARLATAASPLFYLAAPAGACRGGDLSPCQT